MVMSLMAIAPERGPALLLASHDKKTACNLLVNYWATRAQPAKAVALLRQVSGERMIGVAFNAALVRGIAASDPVEAVRLLELMFTNPRLFTPPTAVSQAAGIVSVALATTARERPDQTRLALRRMWTLTQSPEFQGSVAASLPCEVMDLETPVRRCTRNPHGTGVRNSVGK
jgi:hypothetical protein